MTQSVLNRTTGLKSGRYRSKDIVIYRVRHSVTVTLSYTIFQVILHVISHERNPENSVTFRNRNR